MDTSSLRSGGILLHFSSLPGPHGIGDLGPAAYRFADWLAEAGQTLWQVLPVNPVGPGYSPYQSVSAFAGSPLMVALEPLAEAGWLEADAPVPAFDARRVEFERVSAWRIERLRRAYRGFEARATAGERSAFARWCEREAGWLADYALFMALEQAAAGQPWWTWPQPLRERDAGALREAAGRHAGEVAFWQFVQWCFDAQLTALKQHANARGIKLVGDLPIFIAHHSADCWARPDLYELDGEHQPTVVAGVPPDDFSADGQRWGNPLYRWERMAAEGYAWWQARMRRALAQADILRIDHFRGFAGYWEIPASCPTAREGRWVPGPDLALFEALEAAVVPPTPALVDSTRPSTPTASAAPAAPAVPITPRGRLPIIAEDLGLITPDVLALKAGCGFPGMKILQSAFGSDATHDFLPHRYERDCVVYTGTHDNDTVHGWWATATPEEQRHALAYLGCEPADVHWAMMRAASLSVAEMALFPLQDVLGLGGKHRMNLPGTVGGGNWAWRFEQEQLTAELAARLAELAAVGGRGPFAALSARAAHTAPKAPTPCEALGSRTAPPGDRAQRSS